MCLPINVKGLKLHHFICWLYTAFIVGIIPYSLLASYILLIDIILCKLYVGTIPCFCCHHTVVICWNSIWLFGGITLCYLFESYLVIC